MPTFFVLLEPELELRKEQLVVAFVVQQLLLPHLRRPQAVVNRIRKRTCGGTKGAAHSARDYAAGRHRPVIRTCRMSVQTAFKKSRSCETTTSVFVQDCR